MPHDNHPLAIIKSIPIWLFPAAIAFATLVLKIVEVSRRK